MQPKPRASSTGGDTTKPLDVILHRTPIQAMLMSNLDRRGAARVSISLVVPVYNEAAAVTIFLATVETILGGRDDIRTDIIFVNDGSDDATLAHILAFESTDMAITVLDFTRNFGKEAALTAGIDVAGGDVVIPMDVDLQDPPELILEMLERWRDGYDVVLAKRSDRGSDSWWKRTSASLFYRAFNQISSPKIPTDVGDFRLMDRCVVEALKSLPESRRFMKGLFAWVGFTTTDVQYVRPRRSDGETKFSVFRLWNFAIEGLTSFSTSPLKLWTYLGATVAFLSIVFASMIVIKVLITGADLPGYASLIVAITFLGGLQLIGLGVIGEYLGRTYMETKRRPLYLIKRRYDVNRERVDPPLVGEHIDGS